MWAQLVQAAAAPIPCSVTSLGGAPAALRASQQRAAAAAGRTSQRAANRTRSSFLQRPLVSAEDLFY